MSLMGGAWGSVSWAGTLRREGATGKCSRVLSVFILSVPNKRSTPELMSGWLLCGLLKLLIQLACPGEGVQLIELQHSSPGLPRSSCSGFLSAAHPLLSPAWAKGKTGTESVIWSLCDMQIRMVVSSCTAIALCAGMGTDAVISSDSNRQ